MAHVLVIDDHALIRELLEIELTSVGNRVTAVPDGPSGLTVALDDPPDVVVLDFRLPGMDGAEVLRALKILHPALPVFFFTVFADFPGKLELTEADACFVKSGNLGLLCEAIARACPGRAPSLADDADGCEVTPEARSRPDSFGPAEPVE